MATVSRELDATTDDVWAVLSDGWLYSNWVVGTSHMRSVDAQWPAAGSRLEHASGVWPLVVRDSTEVEVCEEPRRLVLLAHGGMLGDARVAVDLSPTGHGCQVTMSERPVSGPGRLMRNPVGDAVLARRNLESLARLEVLAQRRTPPGQDPSCA